jgi:topoisomerase-4 subunit B
VFHFPGGLKDYLTGEIDGQARVTKDLFAGRIERDGGHGSCEWAVCWIANADTAVRSYCNTIPTPEGGTHEAGLRAALTKGLRAYGELTNNKKAAQITAEDVMGTAAAMLSVFIREPEFQGQTKDKLSTAEATRIVETTVRDVFDHWLTDSPQQATRLLEWAIEQAEDRQRRRKEKEVSRQSATRKLRLPGKLTDCSSTSGDTEIFLVEGDSAGGSAKQARDPKTQAILPLRGKILNVASATSTKLSQNQLLSDLIQALGTGTGTKYRDEDLRYDRVIIMTDADVDGAHIASLLMTFFYQEMRPLIENGHLYLAVAPFYKLSHGAKTVYALNDRHREELLKSEFPANAKVTIGRFKGLGEMNPGELKSTTMDPKARTLLKVDIAEADRAAVAESVNTLMGTKPELRFRFIQERAAFAKDLDI